MCFTMRSFVPFKPFQFGCQWPKILTMIAVCKPSFIGLKSDIDGFVVAKHHEVDIQQPTGWMLIGEGVNAEPRLGYQPAVPSRSGFCQTNFSSNVASFHPH